MKNAILRALGLSSIFAVAGAATLVTACGSDPSSAPTGGTGGVGATGGTGIDAGGSGGSGGAGSGGIGAFGGTGGTGGGATDAGLCGPGTVNCSGTCADTQLDPANCGTCGTVCPAGQLCSTGTCGVTCLGGTTECTGVCADTQNDPKNCGACGKACGAGEVCSSGVCAGSCLGNTTDCNGKCVDTQLDPTNCGACGKACPSGTVCSAGVCGVQCSGGTIKCTVGGAAGDGGAPDAGADGGTSEICVDNQNDPANCGACGKVCAAGEVCSGGVCGLQCSGGSTKCGTACVDTQTNPAHCGACSKPCPSGETCSGGNCKVACPTGQIECSGACVNPQTNTTYCGAGPDCTTNKGVQCKATEVCNAAKCECPAGFVDCFGTCINPAVTTCIKTFTYNFTGAMETLTVPFGVTSMDVEVSGAQGGHGHPNPTVFNYGGLVTATVPVSAGDVLNIFVGEQPTGLPGGFNGGGAGEAGGRGGGGASDIRLNGVTLNDRIVVAGGGGGAGLWNSSEVMGGFGGGLVGLLGYRGVITTEGGQGGTQTASGTGTCVSLNNPIVAGAFGIGGTPAGKSCGCQGYGGGGGWWGGAGSGNCRGGGGGSGYTIPGSTSVVHTAGGAAAGHGKVVITL